MKQALFSGQAIPCPRQRRCDWSSWDYASWLRRKLSTDSGSQRTERPKRIGSGKPGVLDQRHQVERLTWYLAHSWAAVARAPGIGSLITSVLLTAVWAMVDFSVRGKTEGIDLRIIGNRANGWIPSVAHCSRWHYSPPVTQVGSLILAEPHRSRLKCFSPRVVCWHSRYAEDAPTSFPDEPLEVRCQGLFFGCESSYAARLYCATSNYVMARRVRRGRIVTAAFAWVQDRKKKTLSGKLFGVLITRSETTVLDCHPCTTQSSIVPYSPCFHPYGFAQQLRTALPYRLSEIMRPPIYRA